MRYVVDVGWPYGMRAQERDIRSWARDLSAADIGSSYHLGMYDLQLEVPARWLAKLLVEKLEELLNIDIHCECGSPHPYVRCSWEPTSVILQWFLVRIRWYVVLKWRER